MQCISYKKGYKYQLFEDYTLNISIYPNKDINTTYIQLFMDGKLIIKKGYAWDGPSGPTFDTSNFMRGSLIHDALYQLMRNECLDKSTHKDFADRLMQKVCKEDGMNALRAWIVYQGVKLFGDTSADPSSKKIVIKAPKNCH